LKFIPELPATTLKTACYEYMFKNCTGLGTLDNTTSGMLCMKDINGAILVDNQIVLPATTLANYCYDGMFTGCKNLKIVNTKLLPATTLASSCYRGMFEGCTSLTAAPELPATTLADYCYASMFKDCTALTTAPALPATTLVYSCYDYLFNGCKNINYINAAFTTTPGSDYTYIWLYNASSKGTFKASPHATWINTIDRSTSTVPAGWSITTT
jgi:hypothetical protein